MRDATCMQRGTLVTKKGTLCRQPTYIFLCILDFLPSIWNRTLRETVGGLVEVSSGQRRKSGVTREGGGREYRNGGLKLCELFWRLIDSIKFEKKCDMRGYFFKANRIGGRLLDTETMEKQENMKIGERRRQLREMPWRRYPSRYLQSSLIWPFVILHE